MCDEVGTTTATADCEQLCVTDGVSRSDVKGRDDLLKKLVVDTVCIGEPLIKAAASFVALDVATELLDPPGGLAVAVETTKTNDCEADTLALTDAHALAVRLRLDCSVTLSVAAAAAVAAVVAVTALLAFAVVDAAAVGEFEAVLTADIDGTTPDGRELGVELGVLITGHSPLTNRRGGAHAMHSRITEPLPPGRATAPPAAPLK